jgi:myo-inositol-1(or 4)-monophosphatase
MTMQQLDDKSLSVILQAVENCARRAGEILLSYQDQSELVYSYKSDGSFATQADLASEKYLIEALRPLVPGAGFYAEESGVHEGNDYQWVIDPLDGTTNFAHGLPYFCVSIALTFKEQPILGVVYHPVGKELFSAQRGCGAFMYANSGKKKLSVSQEKVLAKAMFVMCSDDMAAVVKGLYRQPERPYMRDYGASALDIAYCAGGRFDGCFYQGTKWWDIAAGSLLLEEAGGKVSTLQSGKIGPGNSSFIGGNGLIFEELSQMVRKTVRV